MANVENGIWRKLYDDLVILARKHLNGLPRQVKDEEDIACSAIKSYFRGVEQGRILLPKDDGFSHWPLLSLIAIRKCADLAAYLKAQKRDIRSVSEAEMDQIIGNADAPSAIVEQEESRNKLLNALPDDLLRRIAQWKMEGYTNSEIAETAGINERSVERKIKLIRVVWKEFEKSILHEANI